MLILVGYQIVAIESDLDRTFCLAFTLSQIKINAMGQAITFKLVCPEKVLPEDSSYSECASWHLFAGFPGGGFLNSDKLPWMAVFFVSFMYYRTLKLKSDFLQHQAIVRPILQVLRPKVQQSKRAQVTGQQEVPWGYRDGWVIKNVYHAGEMRRA